MATKGYLAKKDRELSEKLKNQEIAQHEKESKRKFASDVIGAVTGGMSRIIPSFIPKAQRSSSNDASWYKKWLPDVERFVSVPQTNNVHLPYPGMGVIEHTGSAYSVRTATPGIMSIQYYPHIGVYYDGSVTKFPINNALARDLSQIRKANSRSVARNPDELGFYWLSAIEIATLLADLRCALSLVMSFSPDNTYLPRVLLAAKGWDYDSLVTNRPAYIKLYQEFALRFNSNVVIPEDYALLKRRVWLQSCIIKDANLRRGQFYVFNQMAYGKLSDDEDRVVFTLGNSDSSGNVKYTFTTLKTFLTDAFEVLEESTTMVDLVADIRSAIPASKFAKLPLEVSNEAYIFEANDEVLEQIHNSNTLPLSAADTNIGSSFSNIETNGTYLVAATASRTFSLAMGSAANANSVNQVIPELVRFTSVMDSYSPGLDSDHMLTATRLKCSYESFLDTQDASTMWVSAVYYPTEVISKYIIWYYDAASDADSRTTVGTLNVALNKGRISRYTAFDWAPIIYDIYVQSTSIGTYAYATYGELGNAFLMQTVDLAQINNICVQSLNYLDDSVFTASFGK